MTIWQVLRTLISGIIILYLQILLIPKIAIAGVMPNLFLGWIVYQVWRKPMSLIVPLVFFLGICYDLMMPTLLGLQTMIFILLAVSVDEFHRPLEKDSYITMAITLALTCVVYSLLIFMVHGIQSGFSLQLFFVFLGMIAYNLVVAAVVAAAFVFVSLLRLDIRRG
ncbi:MAG: rod shape-determining protein MreD [Candidatus Cloacimonadaceae bacterium]